MDKIKGGYYIKARCIQNSEIAIMPPYIREIWDWLLKEANYIDQKFGGYTVKRGQLLVSFQDIQNGLQWRIGWRKMTYKKWQCENAMKFLRKRTMIITRRTTRGILITICKYETYQNPENYENNKSADRSVVVEKQTTNSITLYKKDKKEKKKESTPVFVNLTKHNINESDNVKLTSVEFNKLVDRYGSVATKKMIEKLANFKEANGKKYKSDYRAILNWVVDWHDKQYPEKIKRERQKELKQNAKELGVNGIVY